MENTMKISDFQLASVLLHLGYPLSSLDRTNPERVKFCFDIDEGETIYEAVDAFWKGTLQLEPKSLFMNQKILKTRLLNER